MYFDTLTSFIQMGGHGPFVWASYGLTLVVVVYNVVAPLRARRQLEQDLKRRVRRESEAL